MEVGDMVARFEEIRNTREIHRWLRKIRVCLVSGYRNSVLDRVVDGLLRQFHHQGHKVQSEPDNSTDVLITSAIFGESLHWREALLFSMRRRYNLSHTPTVFTLLHAMPDQFQALLDRFQAALSKEPPDPADFDFPGLAPKAHQVLIEQGRRGGPILAIERLVQAQAMSIRILLVIGNKEPEEAYFFDLVGAHPRIPCDDPEIFYDDIVLRMVTATSSQEVTNHKVAGKPISLAKWERSTVPKAMHQASLELGKRNFFTPMVRIADLVLVPAVGDAIASQYSEGCFATWEPELAALVATVTGSARPVDKANISDDELAVIMDVRPDGSGAVVHHVEGKRNDPPSSEAVEMMSMDRSLPRITLGGVWGTSAEVPVVRSKLHGHRGVTAYNPKHVEHVYLDAPYYHLPVSCATDAHAWAIEAAFARSEALRNPEDPRQVVFTVLPGHGIVITEKWVPRKTPFQVIWEYIDEGFLEVENRIPQGLLTYTQNSEGRRILKTL
jgi:hypothetical protein